MWNLPAAKMTLLTIILIVLCQNLVIAKRQDNAGHVMDFSPFLSSYQTFYPWHKSFGSPAGIILKSSDESVTFVVNCEEFEEENTKVDVFTKEGLYMETAFLDHIEDRPCEEAKLKNYIIPQPMTNQLQPIIYLMSGKSPKCARRTYRLTKMEFILGVYKYGTTRVACPEHVTKYLESLSDRSQSGGILALAPTYGPSIIMDFTDRAADPGRPRFLEFPSKDVKKEPLTFKCQTDKLTPPKPQNGYAAPQTGTEITTGMIVHDIDVPTVIDKFKMSECDITYINVNRQQYNGYDSYKAVFKEDSGLCYERTYNVLNMASTYFYKQIDVVSKFPEKVVCPKSFVGDIHLNAYRPWYKRWFSKVPEPYATEFNPYVSP